jgi:hypothetical protein
MAAWQLLRVLVLASVIVEANHWVRVSANGNDADSVNESSCSIGSLPTDRAARRIVEILSHLEKFLEKFLTKA